MTWLRRRGLVSRDDIARMTARGPIVDETMLQERSITGDGPDAFSQETLPPGRPLRKLDNVVPTPHLGCLITGNYRHYYVEMVEDIASWLKGTPVRVFR